MTRRERKQLRKHMRVLQQHDSLLRKLERDIKRCRCRRLTKHHRLPKSLNGSDSKDNISLVPQSLHQSYHHLFGNATVEEIANILNRTWIDNDKYLICIDRVNVHKVMALIQGL